MRWLLSGIHTWNRLNVCCWLGLQQKSTYWQKSTWWGGSMQASHQSLSLYLGFTIKAKAHSGSGMTWISLTAIVACTLWFLKFNTSHWISLEGWEETLCSCYRTPKRWEATCVPVLTLLEDYKLKIWIKVERLSLAAALGSRVTVVNTSKVEPLVTTLEGESLALREDLAVDQPEDRELILGLAAETFEKCYVAPLPAHTLPPAGEDTEFLPCP